jgi:cytochrome c oxidase subunit II
MPRAPERPPVTGPLAATPVIPFDGLFTFLMVGAFAVSILIAVLLAVALLRARGQTGLPRQDHGNRRLEIGWTAVPAVVIVFIFGFMFVEMRRGPTPGAGVPTGGQPDVEVIGHQWWWEFRYPKAGGIATANELHLPVGTQALVTLTSADVQHNFWVPELGQKMDLYPRKTNYIWLDTSKPGTYLGVCAEFCGTQHAWMRLRVVVEPQADFDAWAARLRNPPAAGGDLAARGAQVFAAATCGTCHAIAGTEHTARAAPDLSNFGSRTTISAGVIPNTPENLARYLRNPQAVKPGAMMPNFRLSEPEIEALVAYLEGLK